MSLSSLLSNRVSIRQLRLTHILTRWSSTATDMKIGDVIHGYKLEAKDSIKELNIKPYHFRHLKTGSEHLHIEKEGDSNNVFGVMLRTTPNNSTGVPHILEHLALCGSEKYNVRDPFFKMMNRSLATFMNALTGNDFTCYPFSTLNKKDFENLLSVYVDAVFFPSLNLNDFNQEGWRFEHEKTDDQTSPIIIRGVVYNEMKGVFSSSSNIYASKLTNLLYPDLTYKHECGGNPENIPDLSYKELKDFHSSFYHPSNAKFYTYGDFPVEDHLEILNKSVMDRYEANPLAKSNSNVGHQQLWTQPRSVTITCPFDKLAPVLDKQVTTSISFVLPTMITDAQEMNLLHILSTLLLDGPNSPFYKNLVESGIGSDYSPHTGLSSHTKQPHFSVGLQGIKLDDVPKVHEIIEETFLQVANVGFDEARIDSILHTIELNLKHVSGNFGLKLLFGLESCWNHDGDIFRALNVNNLVENFKKNLDKDKSYLTKAINRYFIQNKHKLYLTMSPDTDFEKIKDQREKELIAEKLNKLTDTERKEVFKAGLKLIEDQDSKSDPDILPTLNPTHDIKKELSFKSDLKFEKHNNVSIQICEQPTNEVVYFRAINNLDSLEYNSDLDDYFPILCEVATRLGAGSYGRQDFAEKIKLYTGGLSVGVLLNPHLAKIDDFKKEIILGSYCLKRNIPKMFHLWQQIFTNIDFDSNKEYLKQLLLGLNDELSKGISHSGHLYAIKRSASQLSRLGAIDERLSGLTHITRLKDMINKESIEEIIEKLKFLSHIVFDPRNLRCSINCEPDTTEELLINLKQFLDNSDKLYSIMNQGCIGNLNYELTKVDSINLNFATHFIGKSILTVPRIHQDYPKLVILSKLLSSKFLHKEIREKGGAYGSGLRLSNSGILSFYSYRDPNSTKTLETFEKSYDWLRKEENYSERDIEESKLAVFQDIDRPIDPGQRGQMFFILGETDDMRNEYRNRLLEVSKKDIAKTAQKYLNKPYAGVFVI